MQQGSHHNSKITVGQKGGREKSLVLIRNVKKYVQVYFTNIVLKTNNRLYGWGWNDNNVISSSNKGKYSVKHKKLIDRGVKDLTSTYYGLFYLKKNGNLYFRGKM